VPYSQSDIDKIRAGIATSDLSVEFADRKVIRRSIDELVKAKDHIERELASTPQRRSKRSYGYAVKGY